MRDALLASGRETCGDELPPEWQDEVAALPDLAQGLRIEPAKGLDEALAAFRDAGYVLWIITKGDVIRQAIKLASFGQCHRFSRVEIVSEKTVAAYRRILSNAGIEPSRFLMIGDAFNQDILPVLRLGGRAAHIPAGRWSLLRPLEAIGSRSSHAGLPISAARRRCLPGDAMRRVDAQCPKGSARALSYLCVDMQNMFAEGTPWHTPWMARVLPEVVRHAERHPQRTIFTRLIPGREPGQGREHGRATGRGGRR